MKRQNYSAGKGMEQMMKLKAMPVWMILAFVLLSGCTQKPPASAQSSSVPAEKEQTSESRLAMQAGEYLKDKYALRVYEPASVLFSDLMTSWDEVRYDFQDARGREEFWVRFEGEDPQLITDSYAGYLLRPVIEDSLAAQAATVFGQAKVYADPAEESYPSDIRGPVPFEQLHAMHDQLPVLYASVFVDAEGLDENAFMQKAQELFDVWQSEGLDSVLWVTALPSDVYAKLNDSTSRTIRQSENQYVWSVKQTVTVQ